MSYVILAFGLVLVVEGLVFALAPSRLDDIVEMIRQIPPDTRRLLGLTAVALGTMLVWLARSLGA
ncbi:hypothetical protein EV663_101383 [Rhodovulum bhavnagarense]|uniref:DUF2065 domain-containing protein n=1 Tax=Rhodovulum bhavnagarense TaxID=992286 RepID=A0A4V2SWQ1_9RHOB|nr:DUF2065 domain-containing protein [Rhodovulum bhavnagarense]TCP63116.1 hypothetical protein EV663_101383 [Rhodovulum bhavnagarense]